MRLYDHLFARLDPGAEGEVVADLNSHSLKALSGCRVEPSFAALSEGEVVQFERVGYFCLDPDTTPERRVFNRTVAVRDSWAKVKAKGRQGR